MSIKFFSESELMCFRFAKYFLYAVRDLQPILLLEITNTCLILLNGNWRIINRKLSIEASYYGHTCNIVLFLCWLIAESYISKVIIVNFRVIGYTKRHKNSNKMMLNVF